MTKVIDIDANQEHTVSEVICVHCRCRWVAVRPTVTLLIDIECPECKNQGYVIETGQILQK